jgi:hypothetical protein
VNWGFGSQSCRVDGREDGREDDREDEVCRILGGQHGGVDLEGVRNVVVHMAANAPTLTDHPVAALAFALVDDVGRTADPDV